MELHPSHNPCGSTVGILPGDDALVAMLINEMERKVSKAFRFLPLKYFFPLSIFILCSLRETTLDQRVRVSLCLNLKPPHRDMWRLGSDV